MEGLNFCLLIQIPPLFILLKIILSSHFPLFQNKIPLLEALKQDISLQYFHPQWIFPQEKSEKR